MALAAVDVIGDALFDLILRATTSPPSLSRATEWLRDIMRPPPGVALHADDGSLFTGIVIVKDNIPIAAALMKTGERHVSPSYHRTSARPMFDDPCFYTGDEHE